MVTVTHVRKRNVIRQLAVPPVLNDDGSEKTPGIPERVMPFKTVNQAKRESRAIQKQPGVVLRVEK